MQGIDQDLIARALDWLHAGHRVVMGTVVRTWGSAPRPPGSLMLIRDDGQVAGSVSGGCIEDDLIARVARGELAVRSPQFISYGATAEEAQRFGLPCGGSVQLVLEPLGPQSQLGELLALLQRQQRVQRQLMLDTGLVRLSAAEATGPSVQLDADSLRTLHGPRLRLVIIGAGQLSDCLAQMALMLDHQVIVCDPRREYATQASGALRRHEMPDDLVLALQLDAASALVALTHDPKLDDLALMEALRTPAYYVGCLGSRRNHETRCERLRTQFGLSAAELARLRGPVGLSLGALTPPEIALSIVAELTALQRGASLDGPLRDWSRSSTECRSSSGTAASA